jgi:hypothetical protein
LDTGIARNLFRITLRGKFIHIRYFPIFTGETFRGIPEVSRGAAGAVIWGIIEPLNH